jgi:hypothetical protein
MDRMVCIATRRSPPASWLGSFLFGHGVGRAVGFAAEGSLGSVRLAADRSRGAHRIRVSGFGLSDRPSCPTLCSALVPPNNAFKPNGLRPSA